MRLVTRITVLLTLGIMADAKTTQPNSMEITEEEPVYLPCNHSTISGSEYVYWYRQILLQGPEYVIHGLKSNVTNRMATLAISADRKSSTLILPRVTMGDTAVYYCIARDHTGTDGAAPVQYLPVGKGAAAAF
uniref:T cell receptor alpha variable 26-2 n=1 Tax=Prolemur simus TaxID=1328070 RepID=A0A8C8ZNG0_PROSS